MNFALSWLMYLRQAHPSLGTSAFQHAVGLDANNGSGQDEIAFLKAKARDSKHWSLLSSTLLEEAKLEMCNVRYALDTTPSNHLMTG